jgi:hypothetical protein
MGNLFATHRKAGLLSIQNLHSGSPVTCPDFRLLGCSWPPPTTQEVPAPISEGSTKKGKKPAKPLLPLAPEFKLHAALANCIWAHVKADPKARFPKPKGDGAAVAMFCAGGEKHAANISYHFTGPSAEAYHQADEANAARAPGIQATDLANVKRRARREALKKKEKDNKKNNKV